MTEAKSDPSTPEFEDEVEALKVQAKQLEDSLKSVCTQHKAQIIASELKAEAYRAGLFDLDGLKLLDTTSIDVDEAGVPIGIQEMIRKFQEVKPWLFSTRSSSSPALVPRVTPPRTRSATEMSFEEWRAARAMLIKRK